MAQKVDFFCSLQASLEVPLAPTGGCAALKWCASDNIVTGWREACSSLFKLLMANW